MSGIEHGAVEAEAGREDHRQVGRINLPENVFDNISCSEFLHYNIRTSLHYGLPEIRENADPHQGEMAVCAGGPSLPKFLDAVKGDVFCVNGVHDYLIERGIIPKACVLLDAAAIVKDLVTPHPEVVYYVASQCHPCVFYHLKGHKVVLWHAWNLHKEEEILQDGRLLVLGGSTAALRSMYLGYVLGYRKFRCYGLDSSYNGKTHHAYEAGEVRKSQIRVQYHEKQFDTDIQMALQARDFIDQLNIMGDHGSSIEVWGEGLIPWIWDCYQRGVVEEIMVLGENDAFTG